MDDNHDRPTAAEAWRVNQNCEGRPKLFSYPEPLPISEEVRQPYDEASKQVDEILPRQSKRKRRQR